MIDAAHDLPVARQAEVLDLSRSSVYYRPRPVSPEDLALMRRIDELHLERPFAGSRMLRDFLEHEGVAVGRRHVATLMKRMGIEAIYRRRNSSKPAPGHKIYPYLLRGVKVERPNRVWATDITYIPMARGFVYLVAVVDWFTRRVLSHRVSITMDTTFCVEAQEPVRVIGFLKQVYYTQCTALLSNTISCARSSTFALLGQAPRRGHRQTWQAGDLQLRPRQPIHQRGVHRRPARERDCHQHGR